MPDVGTPLADRLSERGFAVIPRFLPLDACDALVAAIDRLDEQHALRPAGIGRGADHQIRADIRSDRIHWLEEATMPAAAVPAWNRLETLRVELNRSLFLGLRSFEGHVTVYPVGSRYDKHVDNFNGTSARVVSCVLYLNRDWRAGDGGLLRLYRRDDELQVERDVLPEAGTLVCFMSREIPHEVLATQRPRYSLTGWFRTMP